MLYFNSEMINKPNVLVVSEFGLFTVEETQVSSLHSLRRKGKAKPPLPYM